MSTKSSNFFGWVRAIAMVSLITVLLWLMAESQMMLTRTLTVQVVLLPSDERGAGLVARAAPDAAWERTIEVTLEGATSELDRAVRELGGKFELMIGREIPTTPGRHDLELRTALRLHPVIQLSGVRVVEVVPELVRVEVDELITVDIPIRVELPSGVQVQGTPSSEPAQLRLTAPAGVVAQMRRSGLEAVARVSDEVIGQLTPGRTESVRGVVIELASSSSDRWETLIEPTRVDVRLLLRSLTETLELGPMPVQVLVAPDEVGRYVIEIAAADRDVVGVEVTGPAEAVGLIRSGSVVPTTFLALSLDQLESRVTSAQIEVHGLPQGVKVVGTVRTVQLTISPVEVTGQPEGSTP